MRVLFLTLACMFDCMFCQQIWQWRSPNAQYPFMNTSLRWDDRVEDLVSRLSLNEIMYQMAMGGAGPKGGPAPAIERLGIGPYQWNEECLRGAAEAGEATAFPQALGLAAAFSPKLIYQVAEATGVEVRAKHNDYVKKHEYGDHKGLSCFSPVINIMRHPLWGRSQESYGEDPFLSGIYAFHFVQGLQGYHPRYIAANAGCKHFDAYAGPENIPTSRLSFNAEETYGEDPYLSGQYASRFVAGLQGGHIRYVRASAGCKHFDVHGGPENVPVSRFTFDSKVAERDLRLTFLPAFRACVEAGTYSIMCSYNRINGIPACANKQLLSDILRDSWKFRGYVISDEEAVENIVLYHHYFETRMEATIAVVKAGLNIELTTNRKDPYFFSIGMSSCKACWDRFIVNGVPACANHKLLTGVLRNDWGFRGYVISDEVALEFIISQHKYINNTVDTAAACVEAGCNIELSGNNPEVYMRIEDAVKQGKLSEALVRERVKPLFYTRMRLGEFDPAEENPYRQLTLAEVQSPQHRQLAVQAAMQTFVMLKNDNHLLPLKKHFGKIAIVGPMADNLKQLYGDYAADVDTRYASTPLQGLSAMSDHVQYAAGCKDNRCTNYTASDVKSAVQGAQLVVICVGTGQELEAEGNDRHDMDLAGNQTQLVMDAVDASSGSPVLLLVFSAGPVNITFADADPRIAAIMQCFFPAQATGEALFNTITMATSNSSPAGRLPYTWYKTADQIPSMTNYSMEGRTYRYFKGDPLYPFGYGLSYTSFQYLDVTLIPTIEAGDNQFLFGQVMNTGPVDSYEVVQVYITWVTTQEVMPQRQLVGIDRIFIKAGSSQEFKFVIEAHQMAVWTDVRGFVIQQGTIYVYVGGQQPNQQRTTGSNIVTRSYEITGEKYMGTY